MKWASEVGVGDHRRIRQSVEHHDIAPGEEAAIAHLEVAFSRHVLGEDDVVALQFDVLVGDVVDILLNDRGAVDERHRWDQHLAQHVDADRVAGRHAEVARRTIGPEGMCTDAHGHDLLPARVAATSGDAAAEPADRAMRARRRHYEVADGEILHATSPSAVRISVPATKQTTISVAINTYTGGTTLNGGTLELASSGTTGSGGISFAAKAGATLLLDRAALSAGGTFSTKLIGLDTTDVIDPRDLAYSIDATAREGDPIVDIRPRRRAADIDCVDGRRGPGSPAGARGRDRPPPPPETTRSCGARRPAGHR